MKSALVGYGYWGRILYRYLENSDVFDRPQICDPYYPESVSLEEIMNDGEIKAVFICTPIQTHYSLVKRMLEAGKHVFCEKPLCKSMEETYELLGLSRDRKRTLYTDYIYTNSPSVNYLKQKKNVLGKIKYCELTIRQFGNFYKEDDVFDVLAVHMISAVSHILERKIKVEGIEIKAKNVAGIIENASLFFSAGEVRGRIDSSLLFDGKERKIELVAQDGMLSFDVDREEKLQIIKFAEDSEGGYTKEVIEKKNFDESNNIDEALSSFAECIRMGICNDEITMMVSETIEEINRLKHNRQA